MVKKSLLFLVGLGFFGVCYALYTQVYQFLGYRASHARRPLAQEYRKEYGAAGAINLGLPPGRERSVRLARQAFGDRSWQANTVDPPLVFAQVNRGLYLFAGKWQDLGNGKLRLYPFSMIREGKPAANKPGEILTAESDEAFVQFDRPISEPTAAGDARIISGELRGTVHLHSDRRTPADPSDDLDLWTTQISYDEAHEIAWTPDSEWVYFRDGPHTGMGWGMDLALVYDQSPQARARAKHSANITDIREVVLLRDVQMDLQTSGDSAADGFLGSPPPPRRPEPGRTGQRPAPRTAFIQLTCTGLFRFDRERNIARFEDNVRATRTFDHAAYDQLAACDLLVLNFVKAEPRPSQPRTANDPATPKLSLDKLHAVGKWLVVQSDAQKLWAQGNQLDHDVRANRTILRGEPVLALKGQDTIHAPQLTFQGEAGRSGVQSMIARGPGWLDRRDKGQIVWYARWNNELFATQKDKQDGSHDKYDVIEMSGAVHYEDRERGTTSDHLSMELENRPPVAQAGGAAKRLSPNLGVRAGRPLNGAGGTPALPGGGTPAPPGFKIVSKPAPASRSAGLDSDQASSRVPHRIEWTGHVTVVSLQFNIPHTEQFTVTFRDAGPDDPAPRPSPAAQGQAEPPAGAGAKPGARPGAPAESKSADHDPPMNLEARNVRALMVRHGAKTDLSEAWSEGSVHVTQEARGEAEKPTDVRGEVLHLIHTVDGSNIIRVWGEPAVVSSEKLDVSGRVVTLDQVHNRAEVEGHGRMALPSQSSLDGQKLQQPSTVRIEWQTGMRFDGLIADFRGGVVTRQDHSVVRSEVMRAMMSRYVSLKKAMPDQKPGGAKAEVATIHWEGPRGVRADSRSYDPVDGTLVKRQITQSPSLDYDNRKGIAWARAGTDGSATVWLYQRGGADPLAAGAPAPRGSAPRTARPAPQVSQANPASPLRPARTTVVQKPAGQPVPSARAARRPGSPRGGQAGAPPTGAAKDPHALTLTRIKFAVMEAHNREKYAIFRGPVEAISGPVGSDRDDFTDQSNPQRTILDCDHALKVWTVRADGREYHDLEATGNAVVDSQGAQQYYAQGPRITYDDRYDRVIIQGASDQKAFFTQPNLASDKDKTILAQRIDYFRRTNSALGYGVVSLQLDNDTPAQAFAPVPNGGAVGDQPVPVPPAPPSPLDQQKKLAGQPLRRDPDSKQNQVHFGGGRGSNGIVR